MIGATRYPRDASAVIVFDAAAIHLPSGLARLAARRQGVRLIVEFRRLTGPIVRVCSLAHTDRARSVSHRTDCYRRFCEHTHMLREKNYPITAEDLNVLDGLDKGVLLQVPFHLMDKLIAAGLIEVRMTPPDRLSARGRALLREQRDAQASDLGSHATRGVIATQRSGPTSSALRQD
jgi:hypothetical protein